MFHQIEATQSLGWIIVSKTPLMKPLKSLILVPRQAAMHLLRGLLTRRCFLLCTTLVTLQAFLLGPAQARQRYTSINGFATIIFGSKCSTRKPTGFYELRDGTMGTLTSLDCSQQGGDVFTHRFYDTAGSER